MMQQHFETMAAYNAWANERLYDVVAELSEAQINKNLASFFGSLMGTLNHILVGDLVWMGRLDNGGRKPESLDAILHTDFDSLREDRHATDRRITNIVGGLTDQDMAGRISFQTMAGQQCNDLLSEVLTHVFNHQTHHRGQCHTMLSLLGKEAPPLDLIYYIRERDD